MRFDKPILTLPEFCQETGLHRNTVDRFIIKRGKVTYSRNGPRGRIRITREDADQFHSHNTIKATAYGKGKAV